MDDARVQYTYTYDTRGSIHFCDFATVMSKAPMVVKLTAAFVTDDAKLKDKDLTVAYIVEAFVVGAGKGSELVPRQVKVVAGRIISNVFHSDQNATKNVDRDLGASYTIPSEGSLALFTNLMMRGAYKLAVEFEDHSSLIVNVHPTEEILDASEKWMQCGVAVMEHRQPQ